MAAAPTRPSIVGRSDEECTMNTMTVLILLALAATVFSLAAGISTMATHGEVAHHGSDDWMFRRVGFQALAIVLLLVAMFIG